MARYTGPKRKLERRQQATLFGSSNAWQKRPGSPGMHPFSRSRPSGYAVQLREVQKVKRTYGLLEKQFSNLIRKAQKTQGNTGTKLLQFLETRLDNIVYRLNFASTRAQARQFVNHGHVKVNGEKVDIPSYMVGVGDEIEISSKIQGSVIWTIIQSDNENRDLPSWLSSEKNKGKLKEIPARSVLDQDINERLIIEFYSR